jgi:hypothetical protein
MDSAALPQDTPSARFNRWFLEGHVKEIEGPFEAERQHDERPWYHVMCLTGVDYFSTLGYQPGIAFLAAQYLSPIATLMLVLLTLFGALPIYRRVAAESPQGQGSIPMLSELLSWWWAKIAILALLGFVATDFIITITLSSADATAHITENPFTPSFLRHHDVPVTLGLIAILAAVFLKGFKDAMGVAVVLVVVYLSLNAIVVAEGVYQIMRHPEVLPKWQDALFASHGSAVAMVGTALLVFPKLALGLSGFETGVAVMPLVRGEEGDDPVRPVGRVKNTKRMLTGAALIMSVLLILTSFVTTLLIPELEFQPGGKANGRALAYLAHEHMGEVFGTVYDISTILILWFAGASAMAGLLNLVPRYLPRYGMAPSWTTAMRPLVVVYTAIAFAITIIFQANVDAQAGAYATGVLVLMCSAAFAVMLSTWRTRERGWFFAFLLITLVFAYTTLDNIIERPDGIKIASFFIALIVFTSLASRFWRTTELRVERIELDEPSRKFIAEAAARGPIRILANRPHARDINEYEEEEIDKRLLNHLSLEEAVLWLEVDVSDASNFTDVLKVKGVAVGDHRVLRAESSVVANSIAAFLLHLRDTTGKLPHIYFLWGEHHPAVYLFNYVVFGQGDIGQLTREVLRQAEDDRKKRPIVHISGC